MTTLINVSNSLFKRLVGIGRISLDEIFLLQKAIEGYNVKDFEETKIKALINKIIRGGWITEDGLVTEAGIKMWESLFSKTEDLQLNKIEKTEDAFELWWDAFPRNNGFEYKGKKFPVTQSKRGKKEECKVKFHKILSEGQYTVEQLINAVHAEVQARMEDSITKKSNQLDFMSSTLPYLNKGNYEAFIDVSVKTESIKQTQKFL